MIINQTISNRAGRQNSIPVGFQLYTVRGAFEHDVPGTLKELAQIGYKGVEFWGYGGTTNVYKDYSATALRKLLDEVGLLCCGMHLELAALADENLARTIDNNRVLGSEYLNVAAAEKNMHSQQGIGELASILNEAAAKTGPHHMKVGYHAHPFDFLKFNGRFAWEFLFRALRPEVNMQMDVGNCLAGNGDPLAMLKEFPGRTWTIHIKEHEDKTFDSQYYQEVFRLCESACATRWYIVEMGGPDGYGFDIPRQALMNLRRAGNGRETY